MWSAISRSLLQFAPARRPHARRRFTLERLEERAMLSTIALTVNTLADSGPGTLRAEISAADAGAATNNYVIKLKVPGTITLESALPALSNNITIKGLGASNSTVARDQAAPDFGIFVVDAGATVRIKD